MSKSIRLSLLSFMFVIFSLPLFAEKFTDKGNGFQIKCPKGWEYKKKVSGTDVMAFSPLEGESDQFRENFSVSHEDLSSIKSLTLDKYVELSEASMKKMVSGYQRLSLKDRKIDGILAKEFTYKFKMGKFQIQGRLCLVVKNGTGYVLTATATDGSFDKYKNQFNEISDSFKLIPKGKIAAVPAVSKEENGRYINKKLEFSIALPKGWESMDKNGRIFLFSPLEIKDNFRENLNIGTKKIPGNITLAEYSELSIKNMKKGLNEYRNLGEKSLKIDGLPVKRFTYIFAMGKFKLKGITYIIDNNGVAYIISCSMLESSYNKYEKVMQETAESFKAEK